LRARIKVPILKNFTAFGIESLEEIARQSFSSGPLGDQVALLGFRHGSLSNRWR